jgi:hypothetical protein
MAFESWLGQEICLFFKIKSSLALGSIEPYTQCIMGALHQE